MNRNQDDRRYDDNSRDKSNHKSYDDYNILEPSPGSYIQFPEDEDDELSDYTLMDNAHDQEYSE